MDKKNNNSAEGKIIANDDNELAYVGDLAEELEENPELKREKRLHEKFITSEEDDALSENWSEDQEEQNEIHNNFFDNQPTEKKHDITPPKH